MSPATKQARDRALAHVQLAHDNLLAAAQAACDLQGWAGEWQAIGDAADTVKTLWHRCNSAPLPTGHDYEPPNP